MRKWGDPEQQNPTSTPDEKLLKEPKNCGPSAGAMSQEEGHIWFYKEVSQASVAELAVAIHKAANSRRELAFRLELETPPPVHLHIHSYGGEVFAGFAAADLIRQCPVPVYTYIEGGAASAATLFSVYGKKRFIGRDSFILIHQLSSIAWGKYEELKDEMKNNDLLMEKIRNTYARTTRMPSEQIEDILKHDLWFSAEKALELGLVDKVI
jgi:ATP-dependent protease ClpP protease subunit